MTKRQLSAIVILSAMLFAFASAADIPSAITWTTNYTGTPNAKDIAAADLAIQRENEWRAAQDPPLTPLPNTTGAEKKAGALVYLDRLTTSTWQSLVQQAAATPTKKEQLIEGYKQADPSVQAQVDSLLGVQ